MDPPAPAQSAVAAGAASSSSTVDVAPAASLLSRVPWAVWLALASAFWFVHNLYVNQGKILYHPHPPGLPSKGTRGNPPPYNSPGAAAWGGGLSWSELSLTAADGVRLHAWLVRARPPPTLPRGIADAFSAGAPTLVFFHANAGNLGLRLPNVAVLAIKARVNVLIFDYRGYGDSDEAEITEAGLTLDGVAALRAALSRADVDARRVFLFGRSLGGAVALAALAAAAPAERAAVAGVVLENTFSSISDMVDHVMPAIAWLKPLVLRIRWDSAAAIARVEAPLLLISGDADRLVPQSMMRRLQAAAVAAADVEFYSVAGGDHNDAFQKGGDDYVARLLAFIERSLARRGLSVYALEEEVANVGDAAVPHGARAASAAAPIDASIGADGAALLPAALLGAGPDLAAALLPAPR